MAGKARGEDRGWVKLWRKLEDSDVWELSPLGRSVWIWILMNVNTEEKQWRGIKIEPGEMLTSYARIAEGVAWKEDRKVVHPTQKAIRWTLKMLSQRQALRHEPRQGGTWIKVLHWDEYQGKKDSTRAGTTAGTTAEPRQDQGTHLRIKNKEVEEVSGHFDQFWTAYPRKVKKDRAREKYLAAIKEKRGTPDEIYAGLQAWLPMFEKREWEQIPYPATWLHNNQWQDEVGHRGNGGPPRVFTEEEKRQIEYALVLYPTGWEKAQDACPTDELWEEVKRRWKAKTK